MSNPDASEKRGSVKVEGEYAVLHITDQSIMFEKGGKVSGFERSAIRMVKPDVLLERSYPERSRSMWTVSQDPAPRPSLPR